MSVCFCPRLSQATCLLPILRAQLVAAASRHLLPEGFSCDLLPIVEDGIFGYEFLPQRETHTYLTLGCDRSGKPVLRKSLYCAEAPCALRLATINGRVLTPSELEAWHCIQPRDFTFPDWSSAAEAAWRDFSALFPEGPRRSVEIHDARHRCLDEALAIAHSLLAQLGPVHRFLRSSGRSAIRHCADGRQRRIGAVDGANRGRLDAAMGSHGECAARALGRGGTGGRRRLRLGMRRHDAGRPVRFDACPLLPRIRAPRPGIASTTETGAGTGNGPRAEGLWPIVTGHHDRGGPQERAMSHQPPKESKKKAQHTSKEKKAIKQQKKQAGTVAPFIKH